MAARISETVRTPGPTVEAVIAEHIDLLTGVGPDTRSHYRGRRLGRESITTTTETYAHLLPDQQPAAADAAGRMLGGLVPRHS